MGCVLPGSVIWPAPWRGVPPSPISVTLTQHKLRTCTEDTVATDASYHCNARIIPLGAGRAPGHRRPPVSPGDHPLLPGALHFLLSVFPFFLVITGSGVERQREIVALTLFQPWCSQWCPNMCHCNEGPPHLVLSGIGPTLLSCFV